MSDTQCFINGEFVDTADSFDNIDPSTGEVIGTVAAGGVNEMNMAVESGWAAQEAWAKTKPEERADFMERFAQLVERDHEELSRLESEDTGKPLTQARTDATVMARYFRFYGHAIDAYYGITIPVGSDFHVYTRREPLGVVGSIIAWNYPMQLLARAIAPAIVTGNATVIKPADETPRTTVKVAQLAVEAGLPPGIFNVVTGTGEQAGGALTSHGGIRHIGFVGSPEVGSIVMRAAADRLVPTTIESGGKSPHIVFPDADLDQAALFITKGILQNAGQTCSAGSRVLIHEDVRAELLDKLATNFSAVSIGPGIEDRDLGPLISVKQQDRVKSMVSAASGEVVVGGGVPSGFEHGAYFAPTILDGVQSTETIAQEEVFGPVLVGMSFSDEDEAVALANATDYGLMAAVWTKDVSRAHRMAARVEAGQLYVNAFGAGGGVEFPFGGFKKSGYGREKGFEALDAYTATKTVLVKLY